MIWLKLYSDLFCGIWNTHCISALAIVERNTFESQNVVPVVQTSKVKLGGHRGYDFSTFWYCWELEFSEPYQTRTLPVILKQRLMAKLNIDPVGSSAKLWLTCWSKTFLGYAFYGLCTCSFSGLRKIKEKGGFEPSRTLEFSSPSKYKTDQLMIKQ